MAMMPAKPKCLTGNLGYGTGIFAPLDRRRKRTGPESRRRRFAMRAEAGGDAVGGDAVGGIGG